VADDVDVGLPVDGASQHGGVGDCARDTADREPEDADDRHERQSHADDDDEIGDLGAKRCLRVAGGPEVALAGDHHRRVDDHREAHQRERPRGGRPLLAEQQRHERGCSRQRREEDARDDRRGREDLREQAGGVAPTGSDARHRREGHAHQLHQERLRRLHDSQDEAPVRNDRDASDDGGAENQDLVAERRDQVDGLDS